VLPSPGGALEPVGDDVGDLERRVGGEEQADPADVVDVWVGDRQDLDGGVRAPNGLTCRREAREPEPSRADE